MQIKRHIRYLDSGLVLENDGGVELWMRQETVFKEPISVEQPLGNPDPDIFKRTDFDGKTESYDSRRVEPLTNGAGLFRLDEPIQMGDVVTLELRADHLLTDIILDDRHSLMTLLWENDSAKGLIYWITVGVAGTLVFSGKLVPDKEDFCKMLKANKTDLAMREYLTDLYRVKSSTLPVTNDDYPDILNHTQTAALLQISESTLYKNRDIPRLRGNRYSKSAILQYLETKKRRSK